MRVIDAGVLAPALVDDGPARDARRSRLHGQALVAPQLIDLDTPAVFRRRLRTGHVEARRAALALADLRALPLRRPGLRCRIELLS